MRGTSEPILHTKVLKIHIQEQRSEQSKTFKVGFTKFKKVVEILFTIFRDLIQLSLSLYSPMVFQFGLLLLLVPAILAPPPLKKRNVVDQDEFLENFLSSNIFSGWGVPEKLTVSDPKPKQVEEKVDDQSDLYDQKSYSLTQEQQQGENSKPDVQQGEPPIFKKFPNQQQHIQQQQQSTWYIDGKNPVTSIPTVAPTTVTTTASPSTTFVPKTSSPQAAPVQTTIAPAPFNEKLLNSQEAKSTNQKPPPQQVINQLNQNPQFYKEQQKQSQGQEESNSEIFKTTNQQFSQSPPPQKHEDFIRIQSQPPPNQQTNSGGGQPFITPAWPPSECHSQEGNFGVCVPAPVCSYSGGEPTSAPAGCGEGLVCCARSLRKCDMTSKDRVTNIKSPHYPGVTNHLRNCPAHIHLHPDTCQVRVDLLDFNLGKMINGRCHVLDSLLIKSTTGAKIPLRRLCGRVSDPKYLPDPTHFYIHIPSPLGDQKHLLPNKKDLLRLLTFDFNVKNSSSSWNIRVTQIRCSGGSDLLAPPGCSQYHTEATGSILSLNFLDKQYPLGTRLDVCIKRSPGDCGVQYYLSKMGVGTTKTGGLGYGLVSSCMFCGQRCFT